MPKSKIFSFFSRENYKVQQFRRNSKAEEFLIFNFSHRDFHYFLLHFFHFILEILSGLPSIISFIIYCDLFVSVAGTLDQPHP